ncbi:MAG: ABC transporter ATP-binding protein, partial [Clostridia bacterium]|nr:ABC transporter ATP-binding protein [Clostridia bacterium]
MAEILRCDHLKKQYGSFTALKGINLELPEGKVVGLLGPNGSGKTTLIKLASGLLLPTAGEITINGMRPGVETKKLVAYLPERNYLDLSRKIDQHVAFMADFYKDFRKERAYEMLERLDIDPSRPLKELSKGNREKVQLILVMSRDAKLYLLDEPIGGVDPVARDYILETIINNHPENSTFLFSTHLIADVEPVLDEFVFIREGEILQH